MVFRDKNRPGAHINMKQQVSQRVSLNQRVYSRPNGSGPLPSRKTLAESWAAERMGTHTPTTVVGGGYFGNPSEIYFRKGRVMATYVVKSWYADQKADPQGHYVSIKGRAPGFIAWLMSLVGISPTVSFECGVNNIIYEKGSWSGKFVNTIPLSKISSVHYGYAKPWKAALLLAILGSFFGIMLFPLSGAAGLVVMLIAWVIAIIYYHLHKDLALGVIEIGGFASRIDFRRSVIEGIAVDEAGAEYAHNIILALVDRTNSKA